MRSLGGLFVVFGALTFTYAQGLPTCVASAVPALVRSEGLAERPGDIVLTCSGGQPSGAVSLNLTLIFPVAVTNRLRADDTLDVELTIDNSSSPPPVAPPARLMSAGSVAFNGLSFALSPTGTATLRISNLRAAVNQLPPSPAGAPVQVFLSSAGPTNLVITNSQLTVGIAMPGLLANTGATAIACVGSELPDEINLANLLAAGTRFASVRVTEGSANAFRPRGPGEDTGTRILVRYSGFPPGARIFVPDVVAGSSAVQPTAGGDLGVPASGGRYLPGSGSLLLVRVNNTDANGFGGALAFQPGPPGSGVVSFNAASEVTLSGGAGLVVYEIVDANPAVRESAQFPTFVGIGPPAGGVVPIASATVSFAPVSTVATASALAPVPRFAAVQPGVDCTALGDCNAGFLPRLFVDATPPLEYTAAAGSGHQIRYVRIRNEGGGLMLWTASISYQTGSDWLRIENASGVNNATVRIDALPQKLAPGVYRAILTIDAGPVAGARTLPITLTVTAAPPPPPSVVLAPVIDSVTNAATFRPPVSPGALAAIFGSRFSGNSISVTFFDGTPARVLFASDKQINVQVPNLQLPRLVERTSVPVVVTVDGVSSPQFQAVLEAYAPGIFGVLNQDNTVNGASSPARAGSIIQVFATGLGEDGSRIHARVHDRDFLAPLYAGPAPGLVGVQQVNIAVPADLPAMTSEVALCVRVVSGLYGCSPPAPIWLNR